MKHSPTFSNAYLLCPEYPLPDNFPFQKESFDIRTLPGNFMFPHWQDDFELIYVLTGKLEFHINHKTYAVSSGEGFFLNTRQIHYARSYQNYDCTFLSFRVGKEMLCQNEEDPVFQKYILPTISNPSFCHLTLTPKVPWQKYILEIMKKIIHVCNVQNFGYELKIQHFITEIFYYIFQNLSSLPSLSKKEQKDIMRIRTTMDYLNTTYSQKHTLSDISSSCQLSNSECCRLFQRILHCSPVDYLIRLRILKSMPLILEHQKSMAAIAKEVGFSGSSYFSETFKKVIGCSPRDFYKSWNDQ